MMFRIFVFAVLAMLMPVSSAAITPDDGLLLVFTRHAEKAGGEDPCLTEAGRERATRLARLLERMPVKALFSTDYCRTRETLEPLAQERALEVRQYAPMDAQPLLDAALDAGSGVIVIAGHSNTLPALLAITGVEIPDIDENDYGNLYVVFLNKVTGKAGGVVRLSY